MKGTSRDIYSMEGLPVYRMVIEIAAPVMLSLLVQALYSLVDGIFVSRIDEFAISAVSLAFVIQNLEIAVFTGLATGMNALISKALGENNLKKAKDATLNGALLEVAFSFAFILFAFFGVRFYFEKTTSDILVIESGIRYLRPCLFASSIVALQISHERILNAVGMTRYVLMGQVAGSIVNIVLDPILIFGFGSFQGFGIAGAAYATILGQFVSLSTFAYVNYTRNRVFLVKGRSRVDGSLLKKICEVGLPTSTLGISTSIGNWCINRIILNFSTTALGAYGIYVKLQTVLTMPPQGINVALVTVYAFFYGKQSLEKIKETVKWGFLLLFGYGMCCTILLLSVPGPLISMFKPTPEMYEIAIVATRIIALTYFPSMPTHTFTSFFQATEKSYLSMLFITARQFLARIPFAYLLSLLGVINLIWWCYPISEVISDTVIFLVFMHAYRDVKKQIEGGLAARGKREGPEEQLLNE